MSITSTETSLIINSTSISVQNTDISLLSTSVGNGLPIYAGPTAGVIDYNSLSTSGSFISLSLLNGLITPQVSSTEISPFIMPIASNIVPILTSLGGGLPIYAGISAEVLDFNSLSTNGSYVSISETGGLITINAQITSIYQDVGALITNVGVPSYSVFNYSSSVISFKSLSAGSYVSIFSTETSLIINSTFIDTPITNTSIAILSTSVGNGLPIYAGPTAGVIDYNSLSTSGSFISLSLLNGLITPQVSSTEISPFIMPIASNVAPILTSLGGGLPIYAGISAEVLDFNSLSANGSYVSISETGGLITFNAQITSIYQDVGALITNVGVPSYSVFNYSSSVITFKSLSAGSYVSITSTETTLIINSTFIDTPITNTSISLLSTSVGNGLPIYAGPTAGVIDYNSLSTSGSFISLSLLNGLITPQVSSTEISPFIMPIASNIVPILTSLGGGLPIYAGISAEVLDFNSLSANGSYLNISETGGLITINAQITSIYQDVGALITNVGIPSYSVFNYSSLVITFKSLSAGSYVSIFSTETSLIINSTFIDTPLTNTEIALLSTSIGNGLPIYAGPTAGVIDYNSLSTSGSFISLSLLNGLITPQVSSTEISPFIMPIASNVAPILTSLGGGLPIYAGISAEVLDFNSLSANGSYVSISETGGLITFNAQITSIYQDVGALITNVGIPSYSVFNYSSLVITFKSLSAGSYVSIVSTDTSLVINSTSISVQNTDISLLSTSIGNGLPIYAGPTAGVIDYNSLSTSGSFISLSLLNGLITPQVSSTEISPFIMPIASNIVPILTSLGGGLPIYAGISAEVLDFNSLSANGSYVSISETGGLITLNAQITSIYQDVGALITNVGIPSYSVFNYSSSVITFKSLSAGSYVSIVSTETSLVINSTFIDTPLTNTEIALLSTSVGSGLPIYAGPTAGVIDYNSLSTSGSFISLSLLNGLITPQVLITEISQLIAPTNTNISLLLTSIGGGIDVYAGPSAGVLNFNTLSSNGSYISISETSGLITPNAQITSIYQDVGALMTIVGVPSYSVFNYSSSVISFKTLAFGSYIGIESTETTLLINATYVPSPTTNSSIAILSSSVGGGLPIYAGPTAGIIDYNSLSPTGSFISLSLLNGLITPQVLITEISQLIAPTNTNISLLLTSIGGGIDIYAGPSAGVLNFNTLSSNGSYISISETGGIITPNAQITSIYQDIGALMTIVGVPSYSVFNYSSSVISFKTLAFGSYIGIESTETTLLINATYVPSPTTNSSIAILSSSVGGGLPIYAGPTAGVIDYNSLSPTGSFISLSLLNGLITPQVLITEISQLIAPTNTNISLLLTSIGGGIDIYAGPSAGVLNFNTLSSNGSYISISETGGIITPNAQITSIYQDVGALMTIVGVPSYSVFNYSSSVISFKTLAFGSYIGIESTETTLLINATYVPSPTTNSSIAILSSSVGGGLPIYAGPTAGVIDYNSLSPTGSFISLSLLNGLITPQVLITEISQLIAPTNTNISLLLTSIGGGIDVYAGPSAGVLNFNTLSVSSYLNIVESGGLINLNAQITSIYQDVGALMTIVGVPSYSVFNYSSSVISFKTLAFGSYIGIESTETTLLINATYVPSPTTNSSIAILSSSVGGGLPIYAGPTAGIIDYNSLSPIGSFISLSLLNGLITPQVSSTEISPFITPTATNISLVITSIGNGLPIYAGPSAGVLNFNTLSSNGSYLSISETSGLITLNAQITSIYVDIGALITNVGVPSYSVFNYSSSVITFKSLSAGSYVSITSTETSLIINSTFIDTPITNTSIAILSTSVGNGLPIYAGPTAGVIDYNSLSTSGSFISLSLLMG